MLAREVAALRLQALAVQLVCLAEVPVADRIVENHVGFRPYWIAQERVGQEMQPQES